MRVLFFLIIVFHFIDCYSQDQFHFRYGSQFHDRARKVIQTQDGNFIIVGQTRGFGSDGNAFIMKVNSVGEILWLKDYAGINRDEIRDVIELADNKLMMCGATHSFGAGVDDGFIMQTDSFGNVIWSKTYGDLYSEVFLRIVEDGENGFYVGGYAQDSDSNQGSIIMRTDSSGNVMWSKWVEEWQSVGDWWPINILPISSGGVVLCATGSLDGGASLRKFSPLGSLLWSKQYTPIGNSSDFSMLEKSNGNILINHFSWVAENANSVDNCILTLNSNGNFVSNHCFGGIYTDQCRSIMNTNDGGVVIGGYSNSAGNGTFDACLIKINANYQVQWAKAYGTPWQENISSVVQTSDEGYILTGQTWSVGTSFDSSKVHLVKTDYLGNSTCNDISFYPIVTNQPVTQGSNPPSPINFAIEGKSFSWSPNNRYFYAKDICEVVGYDELVINSIKVYPNPFTKFTTLQFEEELQNATLIVKNIFGQIVDETYNINNQEVILNRGELPCGLFIVSVVQNGKIVGLNKLIIVD